MTLISDEQKESKTQILLENRKCQIYRHYFSTNSIDVVILKQNKNVWVSFPLVMCSMGSTYLCVAISGLYSLCCGFRTAMVNVHVQRLFYLSKAFRQIFEMVNRGVLPAIQLRQDKSDLMNLMFFQ